jgi:hypothetical protein
VLSARTLIVSGAASPVRAIRTMTVWHGGIFTPLADDVQTALTDVLCLERIVEVEWPTGSDGRSMLGVWSTAHCTIAQRLPAA